MQTKVQFLIECNSLTVILLTRQLADTNPNPNPNPRQLADSIALPVILLMRASMLITAKMSVFYCQHS